MKKLITFIEKNIMWILPAVTAGLFALLIFSILVPKEVIDTIKVNVTEEEGDKEYMISLQGATISYEMDAGSRPMKGIHVAVAKNGGRFEKGSLRCDIYKKGEKLPVSQNRYALEQGEEIQYVYLPFSNAEACIGDITIQFIYDAEGNRAEEYPGLLANGRELLQTITKIDGKPVEGNLKTMYVYTHNTYPLVYDLRVLTLLFAAASMTLSYQRWGTLFFRKKEKRDAE